MKKIILASQSPRRKELLELLDIDFDVIPSDCDENIEAGLPEEYVKKLSEMKALDVAAGVSDDSFIIGADTIVVFKGNILGKPKDEEEAFRILRSLAGNIHSVYTGVAIVDANEGLKKSFVEETVVEMFDVSDEEIYEYISTRDPFDKAGAYGAQSKGAFLVKGIRGDFYNVVGLPIARLVRELKNI